MNLHCSASLIATEVMIELVGSHTISPASCDVVPSKAVPGAYEVMCLHVERNHRGKGHARAMMDFICEMADRDNQLLILYAQPFGYGGLDKRRLIAFYEAHGFQMMDRKVGLMARPCIAQRMSEDG